MSETEYYITAIEALEYCVDYACMDEANDKLFKESILFFKQFLDHKRQLDKIGAHD